MLDEITANRRLKSTPSGSARRVKTSAAIGVLALLSVAAAWLWTQPVELPDSILCYESVALDSDVAAAPLAGKPDAAACAVVWEQGDLKNPTLATDKDVPPLTACVAESGALAVFPTNDLSVCDSLGLAYPEPSSQEDAERTRQVARDVAQFFQGQECVTMSEAEARVREALDQSGLHNWEIRVQSTSDDRPCASHSFDPNSRTVHLIPIPKSG